MMASADEIAVTSCAPGQRTPKDQIKQRERAPVAGTIIRISGQSILSRRQQEDEAEIMSVALNQPHRRGVSTYPGDAWMATALGRFCREKGTDRGTQHDYWTCGERYAQLIDAERISRGEQPRQCAEAESTGAVLTIEEARKRRDEAEDRLQGPEDAMREVDNRAVRVVRDMAYFDRDIPADQYGRAFNAIYKLKVYFERLDNPRR